jgi:hypothetical protein
MEKMILWESCERNPENGKYFGKLLDPDNVFEGVSTFEFDFVMFPGVPGDKVVEYNLDFNADGLTEDEVLNILENIVGVAPEYPAGDYVPVEDVLCFDLQELVFFDLKFCISETCYEYVKNSNLTTIVYDENRDTQYDLEVLDSYNLDILDDCSNSYYPYKSTGSHALLEKVRINDSEVGLLWHEWSQWQGQELDEGFLITPEEALEMLAEHPEIEEITNWLKSGAKDRS